MYIYFFKIKIVMICNETRVLGYVSDITRFTSSGRRGWECFVSHSSALCSVTAPNEAGEASKLGGGVEEQQCTHPPGPIVP